MILETFSQKWGQKFAFLTRNKSQNAETKDLSIGDQENRKKISPNIVENGEDHNIGPSFEGSEIAVDSLKSLVWTSGGVDDSSCLVAAFDAGSTSHL
jgi:hypothetical protein